MQYASSMQYISNTWTICSKREGLIDVAFTELVNRRNLDVIHSPWVQVSEVVAHRMKDGRGCRPWYSKVYPLFFGVTLLLEGEGHRKSVQ